jgi:hypothetical protein
MGNVTPTPTLPTFDNAAEIKSLQDFVDRFEVLAYEWSNDGTTTGTYRMEFVGTEDLEGVSTDHLKVTTGNGGSDQVTEIWTDEQNSVRKLVMNGSEVPEDQLAAFGPLATAGFFAPLAAVPDLSEFDQTVAIPGGLYTVSSTRTESKQFGDLTAQTYVMEVSVTGQGNVTWEISDFGDVSLFTAMRFQAAGSTSTSSFEVTEVSFRN